MTETSVADLQRSALPVPFASAPPAPAPAPRRVLIVSANIGGGHDSTGRALQERVQQLWPGSHIEWVDTLDAMGPGVGPTFRRLYVINVEVTPWLYEFFYWALWHHRWFARASIEFVGAWAGRQLAPVIEAFDPDIIISTYPLGSAGLAWLRRRRGLAVPTGAWVSDFAPHPFWVYPELDLNLVVHPSAVPLAEQAAPGARVAVCMPPVATRFRPGDQRLARARLALNPTSRVVLVACGSLGFGAVEEAVQTLCQAEGPLHVVAVCGRNERLAERLRRLQLPKDRLTVLGWVDDMPTLLQASDLLLTNAGGATALEAMATGTPVLMYRPIAAHGAANAALMAKSGVAQTCHAAHELRAYVEEWLAQPTGPVHHVTDTALPDLGLPDLAAAQQSAPRRRSQARRPSWPLRANDAFFLHVQSPTVAQQIGAVLELGPTRDGRPLTRADLVRLVAHRIPAITTLRRRLVSRGRWRRPGWVIEPSVDVEAHIEEYRVSVDGSADGSAEAAAAAAIDEFWSRPLPTDRPMWRILLVTGLPGATTRLAVKLHHCLGDGLSVIGTLRRLLDAAPPWRDTRRTNPPGDPPARPHRRSVSARLRDALRACALDATGLVRLATAGTAPPSTLNRPLATARRRLFTAVLPTVEVKRVARECGVNASELLCGLVAEALRRAYPDRAVPSHLRAMLAVSRGPRVRSRTHGNWAGAVALDLPMQPVPAPVRVAAVRERLRRSLASGQPAAAELVMRAMGLLPAPLHAALARRVYSNRFMNLLVAYLSDTNAAATSHPHVLAGAPIRWIAPVVSLAEGVPIGVGALRWADTTGIGVLLDESLGDLGDRLMAALREAFAELSRAVARPAGAADSGPANPDGRPPTAAPGHSPEFTSRNDGHVPPGTTSRKRGSGRRS